MNNHLNLHVQQLYQSRYLEVPQHTLQVQLLLLLENFSFSPLHIKYKTLPNGKPIVRQNIEADAFPIVVLDILFGEEKKKNFLEEEATELAKYVVAPLEAHYFAIPS